MSFPDAQYLGIWTRPRGGFVCIEPWRGIADPVDFAGEFDEAWRGDGAADGLR